MPEQFRNLARSSRYRLRPRLPRNEAHAVAIRDVDFPITNHDRVMEDGAAGGGTGAALTDADNRHLEENLSDAESVPGNEENLHEIDRGDEENANNFNEPEEEEEVLNRDSDSDSDNDYGRNDRDFGEAERMDIPLYPGAPLTLLESMSIILSLSLRHNLTSTCIYDILTAINMHCPQQGLRKLTPGLYDKFFSIPNVQSRKLFYCSQCCRELRSAEDQCECSSGVSYFLQYPLVPQLKEFFKRPNFFESLQHRFQRRKINENAFEDIYDGSLYKNLYDSGFLSEPNHCSFLWNSDGAPVYNSKNYSIWPFYLAINELPIKKRFERKNVLLAGLWFGREKPKVNSFVKAFRRDFQKLYEGVQLYVHGYPNPLHIRAILLAGTCDLPAKAAFLNFIQYNGKWGCPHCETEGTQFRLTPKNTLQVYHYERNFAIRTLERCRMHAEQALNSNDPVFGVKGPTYLDLVMPDFIAGMGIDFMHNASGIVKKLLTFWFDSTYSELQLSLRNVIPVIDEKLLSLKPPKFVHRMPRSVEELCHWKASELIMFLFYYAPIVLNGIMMPQYFQHFMKLVVGLSFLSSTSVSLNAIDIANLLLHKFAEDYQTLYGLRHCTINVHLLLHLSHQVRLFGPLWTSSCFSFENLNAHLLNSIHGTTNLDSQLTRQHWQVLCSARFFDILPNMHVRNFCSWNRKKFKALDQIGPSCYSVGSYIDLDPHQDVIQQSLVNARINFQNLKKYARLFKGNMMYTSESYIRDVKTKSSFCMYTLNERKYPGNILCFVKVCNTCGVNVHCVCQGDHFAIIKKMSVNSTLQVEYAPGREATVDYFYKCDSLDVFIAVPVNCLQTVCFYMHVEGESFLAEPAHITGVL